MVDLYYTLYGVRMPACLSNQELGSILRAQKPSSGFGYSDRGGSRRSSPAPDDAMPLAPYTIPKRDRSATPEPADVKESFDMIEIGDTKVMIPRSRDGSPYDDAESRAREEQEDNERVARENQRIIETVEASIKKEAGETGNKSMEQVKEEVIDLDDNDPPSGVLEKEPPSKKIKAEFYSDNSISLPGISMGSSKGAGGPTGFEPGMFGKAGMANESSAAVDPNSSKTDGSKVSMPGWGRLNVFFCRANVTNMLLFGRKRKRRTRRSISTSTNTSTTRTRTGSGTGRRIRSGAEVIATGTRARTRRIPTLCG